LSGNFALLIDLFISFVIGFTITGLAIFIIFTDTPSKPVRAIYQQLINYFDNIFNPYLSAFRPGYGCNIALLKVIEDLKKAVDNNLYVAAVLMDLSKAFDCLLRNTLKSTGTKIDPCGTPL
jgi:hypothetical protein